jgi:hypothetical protein
MMQLAGEPGLVRVVLETCREWEDDEEEEKEEEEEKDEDEEEEGQGDLPGQGSSQHGSREDEG